MNSGNLLKSNGFYAPSVHCFYYSFYQNLLNNLAKSGVPKSEISGASSHVNAFKLFISILRSTKDPYSAIQFSNYSYSFKKLRERADYRNSEILQTDSDKAESLLLSLNGILK